MKALVMAATTHTAEHSKKYFFSFLKKHWFLYTLGALSMFAVSLSEVAFPKIIQWMVDFLTKKYTSNPLGLFDSVAPKQTIINLTLIAAVAAVGGLFFRFMWRQTLARLTHIAGKQLRVDLWQALTHQPISFFRTHQLGKLINIASSDWNSARYLFGFAFVIILDLVFFVILGLIAIMSIDPKLGFLSLIGFLFVPWVILKISDKEWDEHTKAQQLPFFRCLR